MIAYVLLIIIINVFGLPKYLYFLVVIGMLIEVLKDLWLCSIQKVCEAMGRLLIAHLEGKDGSI